MVSTAYIYPLFTYLLKEHEEVTIPAITYFIKHCEGGEIKLVKTKGQLFIQRSDDECEFIGVFFFHDYKLKNGGMPDSSGKILSRYNYTYSWWMFSFESPRGEEPGCDGAWAYICLHIGDSTVTIKSPYVKEGAFPIED